MISILISTYNGEKYIREQIDSILSQTYGDWKLYVRDDGSLDNTISIIEHYMDVYPDKIFLCRDLLGNLGPGRSFMTLLENIDSDYYMFCDQDDVWLPSKIEMSMLKMKECEGVYLNKPLCVFTDLKIVDSDLKLISSSMWKSLNISSSRCNDFYFLSCSWVVTGCTMLLNRKVKDFVFPYSGKIMHDYWISLILSRKGYNIPLDLTTILYRQQGNNVVGASKNNTCRYYLSRFLFIKDVIRFYICFSCYLNDLPNIKVNHIKRFIRKIECVILGL